MVQRAGDFSYAGAADLCADGGIVAGVFECRRDAGPAVSGQSDSCELHQQFGTGFAELLSAAERCFDWNGCTTTRRIRRGRRTTDQISARFNRSFGQAPREVGAAGLVGADVGGGRQQQNQNAPPVLRQSIAEIFCVLAFGGEFAEFRSPLLGGNTATTDTVCRARIRWAMGG